jgi:hypothetical protein
MNLRMEKIVLLAAGAVMLVGCRSVGLESLNSASAPNTNKFPYKGDPYAWGGIQEGTGGQVVGTKQTMEGTTFDGDKYKKLAGPDEVVSMSGHRLAKAKPSDTVGDRQPLPGDVSHGGATEGEGH